LQSAVALARVKLQQKDTAGAEEVLKKSVSSAPKSADAAVALGQLYITLRRAAEAETQIRRALGIDPKNTPAPAALSSRLLRQKKTGEAEGIYKQLAASSERYRTVYAGFLYLNGKRDQATAELERLSRQYPDSPDVRAQLLALYFEQNKPQAAENLIAA